MASGYKYECDGFLCGYSFTTSGSWEFYRDDAGKVHQYGHPGPLSKEAERRGIWGYQDHMYCLDCDKQSEIIVSEIPNRFRERSVVWKKRLSKKWFKRMFSFMMPQKYRVEDKVDIRCPSCNSARVVHSVPEGTKCPRCNEGTLIGGRNMVC